MSATHSSLNEVRADLTVDVAVVGAGFAGVIAALRSRELGASVILIDASLDGARSNSRMSGGKFHAAGLPPSAAPSDVIELVRTATGGEFNLAVVSAWANNFSRAYDWLRAKGVRFAKLWGVPVFVPVRPNRRGEVWRGFGVDVAIRRLLARFEEAGGVMRTGYRVTRRYAVEGPCWLTAESTDGGQALTVSTGSTILADGGFQASDDLLRQYAGVPCPGQLVTRGAGTGEGHAARIALDAGGHLVGTRALYAHVLHRDAAKGNVELLFFPVLDQLVSGGVLVDGEGRRFHNEGLGGISAANALARMSNPSQAWLILDQAAWNERARGHNQIVPPDPNLLLAGAEIASTSTPSDLADLMGCSREQLAASLAGSDPRPDGLSPPPRLAPPYFAFPLVVGLTSTMGGIAIDENARVVRPDGSAVPGLFAAGACVGGVSGGPTPGYVGGLSVAAAQGLLAAESAVAEAMTPGGGQLE